MLVALCRAINSFYASIAYGTSGPTVVNGCFPTLRVRHFAGCTISMRVMFLQQNNIALIAIPTTRMEPHRLKQLLI